MMKIMKPVEFKPFAKLINEDIIKNLEIALQEAKEGKYSAIAFSFVHSENKAIGCYTHVGQSHYELIGSVACMQQKLISEHGFE